MMCHFKLTSAAAALILSLIVAGCGTHPTHWPVVHEDRQTVAVIVGQFGTWHQLDEMPCLMTSQSLSEGEHCYSGFPVVNAFTVIKVVHGIPARSIWLYSIGSNPSPPTSYKRAASLVPVIHDGRSYFLATRDRLPVVKTRDGQLAIPVLDERRLTALPCESRTLVKPLRFERWVEYRPVSDFDPEDLASLRTNPEFRQEGAYVRTHRGILLSDLQAFFDKHGVDRKTILCPLPFEVEE